MLPTIEEFGIQYPVYIRKIDARTHWAPEDCNSPEERAKRVADKLFKDSIYSIWRVTSDSEFYGLIASLSAGRDSKEKNIDFIWITEDELKEVGITPEQKLEGKCLYVQKLHYNAKIDNTKAEILCYKMLRKDREAQRCQKKITISILQHQEELGCKATNSNLPKCACETWEP